MFPELERFYFHSSQASESPYLRWFRKWKIYFSRGTVSQPVDEEIGRPVLFKAPSVFQRNQVAPILKKHNIQFMYHALMALKMTFFTYQTQTN